MTVKTKPAPTTQADEVLALAGSDPIYIEYDLAGNLTKIETKNIDALNYASTKGLT